MNKLELIQEIDGWTLQIRNKSEDFAYWLLDQEKNLLREGVIHSRHQLAYDLFNLPMSHYFDNRLGIINDDDRADLIEKAHKALENVPEQGARWHWVTFQSVRNEDVLVIEARYEDRSFLPLIFLFKT